MGRRPKNHEQLSLVDQLDEMELKAARVRRQLHEAIRDGTLSDYDQLRLKSKYRDADEFRAMEASKTNGRNKKSTIDSKPTEPVAQKKEGPYEVAAS